jgi:DNA-binding GntR family transcriptional regulator
VTEPVKHMTVTETVADLLRREIHHRELQPGDRLRQDAIARKYGVSTTPVREAFALLQSEGLVHIDPHKGAIVFLPRIEDLTENYEIRGALEGLALEKAIDRLTLAELDELQAIADRMKRTAEKDDWVELNNEFHRRLYEASGLPRLVQMIADLRQWASAYVHLRIAHEDVHDRVANDEHQEILDVCRAKDHDHARDVITRHVASGIEHLREIIERQEQPTGRGESDPERPED